MCVCVCVCARARVRVSVCYICHVTLILQDADMSADIFVEDVPLLRSSSGSGKRTHLVSAGIPLDPAFFLFGHHKNDLANPKSELGRCVGLQQQHMR